MDLNLFIVTLAAFLDSINPCAISVLLLTIGFLLSLGKGRGHIYKIGFVYIGSLYLTYLFIGLGVLQALTFFGFPHFLAKIGAIFLFMTGLINLLGAFFPEFPVRLKIPKTAHPILAKFMSQASIPSALILGFLVGLFEFPCTGGPYLSILSLLHDRAANILGLIYLLYYNLVFVSPLIIILAAANSKRVVDKFEGWRKIYTRRADMVVSVMMIALSAIIFLSA